MSQAATIETKKEEPAAPTTRYTFDFTLGADPEFTVLSGTRPMAARDIMLAFFKDVEANSPGGSRNQGGWVFPGGNIGWDGHNATGEVRPNPGTPEEVVANLKSLFAEAQKRMPFVDLNTLSYASSTGGHIHVAIPAFLTDTMVTRSEKGKAIERAMASFMLLIMLGENEFSRELRRRNGNYGDLLDYRYEQKFTHPNGAPGYTMEIRVASAEWITTEKLALGTLAYAAIAWDSILKQRLAPVDSIIFKNKQEISDVLVPILSNYANTQRLYLNHVKPFVRAHPAYKQYKDALELVLNPERSKQAKKDAEFSVASGWGLAKQARHIKTKDFLNEEVAEKGTDQFPESVLRNISQFAYNDDINVESFATALAKRCVALSWKPQHEYYLFGMKKGFNDIVIRDERGTFVMGTNAIKTKDDLRAFQEKFAKLESRANPVFGRFINPKSGLLVKDGELKRVMVGIPYSMRKANDTKTLIRAIVKFEKNPKAFPPIDVAHLPDAKGEVRAALANEEETERLMQAAEDNADTPRQVSGEEITAAREREQAEATLSSNLETLAAFSLSQLSRDIIEVRVQEWLRLGERQPYAFVADNIASQLGRTLNNGERIIIRNETEALLNASRGVPFAETFARALNLRCVALILLAHFGLEGSMQRSDRIQPNSHIVRRTQDERAVEMSTPGRNNYRVVSSDVLADLFGLEGTARETIFQNITPGRPMTITLGGIGTDTGQGYSVDLATQTIVVYPHEQAKTIWSPLLAVTN